MATLAPPHGYTCASRWPYLRQGVGVAYRELAVCRKCVLAEVLQGRFNLCIFARTRVKERLMKPYQLLAMFLFPFFASCRQQVPEEPRISIFADHIVTAAQQEGISFAEAAARFREMGYAGVDVSTNIDPALLQTLDSLGFAHACAIIWIDLVAGPGEAEEEGALDFMRRTGWDKLLLVPGFLPEDAGDEVRDAAVARVAAFADKAAAEGFPVLVEDFDNPRSLCYDTGNYLYCGEDVLPALEHFRDRIGHVHLKDRRAKSDAASVPVGAGIVPVKEGVDKLLESGYDGWFTVEQYGSAQMLQDASVSIRTVRAALTK